MNIKDYKDLTKKYSVCPVCGNDKVGGNTSEGMLIIENDIFTRSCKCGWSVTVDKRIKVVAHATRRKNGVTTGIVEIKFHDKATRKCVDLTRLKEKSGAKRATHSKIMEDWLNTKEGREWALKEPHKRFF